MSKQRTYRSAYNEKTPKIPERNKYPKFGTAGKIPRAVLINENDGVYSKIMTVVTLKQSTRATIH